MIRTLVVCCVFAGKQFLLTMIDMDQISFSLVFCLLLSKCDKFNVVFHPPHLSKCHAIFHFSQSCFFFQIFLAKKNCLHRSRSGKIEQTFISIFKFLQFSSIVLFLIFFIFQRDLEEEGGLADRMTKTAVLLRRIEKNNKNFNKRNEILTPIPPFASPTKFSTT